MDMLERGGFFSMPIKVQICLSIVLAEQMPGQQHFLTQTKIMTPLQQAADKLHCGTTTLKSICRRADIQRWPARKRNRIARLGERAALKLKLCEATVPGYSPE